MAKVGPKEQGGYDPFNAISDSLSDLAADPAPASVAAPPKPANPKPRRQVKPAKTAAPTTPEPVVVETPIQEPAPAVAEPPPAVNGGGGRPLPTPSTRPKTVSAASALQTTKRFKTTKQEGLELDAAAVKLGAALGVSVDFSKVTRALWDVYLRHQEDILRNVPDGVLWERPANNDAAGLAELDERLADLINEGFMVACRRPPNRR